MSTLQIATYTVYGSLLLIFLVLAAFAVFHAFKYSYISPRTRIVTWIFILVSTVLVSLSLWFLFNIEF